MLVTSNKWASAHTEEIIPAPPLTVPVTTPAPYSFLNNLICLLAVVAVGFSGIIGHDLWTPDEPRVAAIVHEMARTGNFVIPHLAGVPFIEKPPLYFAAAALMLKLLGSVIGPAGAIRLTSAFFGLGVLLMTFLITRRLWDNTTGLLAAAALGTMEGFVENFHWIVVDPALSFFVIAVVWCLVESYVYHRRAWLVPAGFFLAGAFLSKGTVGPALTAAPWTGLLAIRLFSNQKNPGAIRRFLTGHLLLLIVFGVISGIWVVMLYIKGGPALWDEWFWVNQIGRFTGQAAKGHIKPGQPFYYVLQAIGYAMPWTPLVVYWFVTVTRRLIKEKQITRENFFLYIWSTVSIVFLTLAATKRGLYLLPVMPVFAIMTAISLKQLTSAWFKWYSRFWMFICLIVITVIFILPLVPITLPDLIPGPAQAVLTNFSHYQVIAGIWLIVCLAAITRFRRIIPGEILMILATTGLLVSYLGAPVQAIDRQESMAADVRGFVSRIPEARRGRIAGVGFSETMLGAFSFYTDWQVPRVTDEARINRILDGQDNTYDSLLVNCRDKHDKLHPETDLVPAPYRILSQMVSGDHEHRKVFWITGTRPGPARSIPMSNIQG